VRQCQAAAVLTADISNKLSSDLEACIGGSTDASFRSIPIKPNIWRPSLSPSQFQVSSDTYLDQNAAGLVIFTSGTTGPPKGVVKRRGFFHDVAMTFGDQHGLQEADVVLHVLPVHHATGITVTLLPFLYAGGCIEFRSGSFDPGWTWERIRQGGLTYFSGVPTIYMRLMQHYERHLANLPEVTLGAYVTGVREFRAMLCGTSALPRPLQQKWVELRAGKLICTRYGGTEFGSGFIVTPWSTGVPDVCLQTLLPSDHIALTVLNPGLRWRENTRC
jgi:malonyl-CoA/methylmalonyl-CoA synthetase